MALVEFLSAIPLWHKQMGLTEINMNEFDLIPGQTRALCQTGALLCLFFLFPLPFNLQTGLGEC